LRTIVYAVEAKSALWEEVQSVAVIRLGKGGFQPCRIAGFRWNVAKCQLSIGCQCGPLEDVAVVEHTTHEGQISLLKATASQIHVGFHNARIKCSGKQGGDGQVA